MINFELNNIHKYGSPKMDKLDYSDALWKGEY